jgi:molybdopterin biosynthesis enzyme MoaB
MIDKGSEGDPGQVVASLRRPRTYSGRREGGVNNQNLVMPLPGSLGSLGEHANEEVSQVSIAELDLVLRVLDEVLAEIKEARAKQDPGSYAND